MLQKKLLLKKCHVRKKSEFGKKNGEQIGSMGCNFYKTEGSDYVVFE